MTQNASQENKKRGPVTQRTTLQLTREALSFMSYMRDVHMANPSTAVNMVFSHFLQGNFTTLASWLSDYKSRRQF